MKCKMCGTKIKTRLSQTDIMVDGAPVHVINIPAFYCKNCDREFFHEIVLQKAKTYALESHTDQLDYCGIENEESEEMLANGLL
jgi:YgiT-type zinc finger domain-containing protein